MFTKEEEDDHRIPLRILAWAMGGTICLCAAAYPLVSSVAPCADAAYLIDRIDMLNAGQRPYIDFEYAYGPFFLYPPLWIARLFHTGIAQAYFWYWLANALAGIFLLFRVINEIDVPSRSRANVFVLFCAAAGTTVILGAVSYTFLRFALAPYLAFGIQRTYLRAHSQGRGPSTTFGLVVLSFALLLSISPEIALAFAIGSWAFFLLQGNWRSPRWWAGYMGMLAAITAATWTADRIHLLDTLKTFGGGTRDFPIFPAGHILLLFACVFIAALHLARAGLEIGKDRSAYLILLSIPMLPAALGSCDPLHVFFGGFGFLAVGLLYLGRSKHSRDIASIAFVLFFVIALFAGLALERSQEYRARLRHLVREGGGERLISIAEAFPDAHGVLEAPFGFSTPTVEGYHAPWIDYGRYFGTANAPSVHDVQIKLRELHQHPDKEVLVPEDYEKSRTFDESAAQLWMEVEFAAPFSRPLKNLHNPYAALCDFLDSNYHKVLSANPRSYRYEVWARNK